MIERKFNLGFSTLLGVTLFFFLGLLTNYGSENVSLAQTDVEVTPTFSADPISNASGSAQPPEEGQGNNSLTAQSNRSSSHIYNIESYNVADNILTIYQEHRFTGNFSGFRWQFGLGVAGELLGDPSFNPTGGANCNWVESIRRVKCTGKLSTFTLSYQIKPTVENSDINFSFGFDWTGVRVDMTYDFFYPNSLTLINTTNPPTIEEPGHLLWSENNSSGIRSQLTLWIPQPCGVKENRLDTCNLEIGDLIIIRTRSFTTGFIERLGESYYTHVGIYSGNGHVIEAPELFKPVREKPLEYSSWLSRDLLAWTIIRPNTTLANKQSAVNYARSMIGTPYDIAADRESQSHVYCSSLVWQAYMQTGLNLHIDNQLVDTHVTPSELTYGTAAWANIAEEVQFSIYPHIDNDRRNYNWSIRMYSPASLTLIDPLGRRTGYNNLDAESSFLEIPGSIYSNSDAQVETISITDTGISGNWTLIVTGIGHGNYKIEGWPVVIPFENYAPETIQGTTFPGKQEVFIIPDPTQTQSITINPIFNTYLPSIISN